MGKQGCVPPNEIIFGGRDIRPKHAQIIIDDEGNVRLRPLSHGSHLYVNGKPVEEETILKNLDRVIFGWNSVYLFKDTKHEREGNSVDESQVTWDWVKKEVAKYVDIDQSDSEDGGGCCKIF